MKATQPRSRNQSQTQIWHGVVGLQTQLINAPNAPRATEPPTTLGDHAETVEALITSRGAATDIPLLRPDSITEPSGATGRGTSAALAIRSVDGDGI